MTANHWQGFYKLSRQERIQHLLDQKIINQDQAQNLQNGLGLDPQTADDMVENLIGTYQLPFALVMNYQINSRDFLIPIATEEPSVVAAASYAGKLAKAGGGFTSHVIKRLMTGEIAILNVKDQEAADQLAQNIDQSAEEIINIANQAYPSIVKRGGGCQKVSTHYYAATEVNEAFFVVYLHIDSQEAMGANMMNTMLEAVKNSFNQEFAQQEVDYHAFMAILSNHSTNCLVTSQCQIPAQALDRPGHDGRLVAKAIAQASQLAQVDPYRAATHNKGIMNGIDGLVIASGNDWRAIEAACHSYASRDGHYRGLSHWTYDSFNEKLHGEMTLPLPLASVGGSIGIHPNAQLAHQLMGHPDAKTLMTIAASLGLGQNLAALRALVSEGIQEGHMQLQAKSLAMQAGAHSNELSGVIAILETMPHLNQSSAREAIKQYRLQNSNH
ncbi:hydroxymethylglutaryl-CoA reductase, degradative [Aerococcus kribbianus]|uniref:3-hydroxy-3-methylglutaryl coenzyme A reductase n=1 Tax=Aerococcus kribbianus TaxID=2999064 RepID=A0A9X3JFN1_9LACT|nr:MULTISPECIES: hydroxymethylglutaryl-CoA reductase, degradative [unclassified Aerococcus]MCZ0717247.1 hydroxymethylglutaryl-CoA reductase, degradative [Aerococcus sp. YH-aer221]MCZ0725535.1 hydroxymethylglutaryl-CoA reductase, degradative [Aerococcus sp. YH-aer222]